MLIVLCLILYLTEFSYICVDFYCCRPYRLMTHNIHSQLKKTNGWLSTLSVSETAWGLRVGSPTLRRGVPRFHELRFHCTFPQMKAIFPSFRQLRSAGVTVGGSEDQKFCSSGQILSSDGCSAVCKPVFCRSSASLGPPGGRRVQPVSSRSALGRF